MARFRPVALVAGAVAGLAITAGIAAARDGGRTVAKLDPAVTFAEPGLGGAPKLNGTPLPDGTFTRLAGGTATFASLRGRPAIINLWSQT